MASWDRRSDRLPRSGRLPPKGRGAQGIPGQVLRCQTWGKGYTVLADESGTGGLVLRDESVCRYCSNIPIRAHARGPLTWPGGLVSMAFDGWRVAGGLRMWATRVAFETATGRGCHLVPFCVVGTAHSQCDRRA